VAPEPAQESVRVLLVDDQEANLVALEAVLGDLDVTLVRATSGEEALWRALAADFAAVLLDVRMPGMSGFAVARLLRSRPRSQMMPILFLTAGESAEFSLQEGYALGAVDYLVKPIVPEVLRAKVAFFIDSYRQLQGLRSAEQRAQRELHATARRLKRLADASGWIAAAPDVDALLRVVTEEARALMGARRARAQLADAARATASAQAPGEATPLPDHPGLLRAVAAEGRPLRLTRAELEARDEWSEVRAEVELRGLLAAPIVGQGGEVLGAVALADRLDGEFTEEDEAVLVQLARSTAVAVEKLRLAQALRDADRRRDEFLAILAHELRNPLAPIRSALAVLADRDVSDATRAQLQGVLTRQVRHLARIADDLLDVARIAGDKLTIRRETVELAHVVALAVEATRQFVEAKRHTLFVDVASEPIALDADPLRLSQALANILDNAARYTGEGGRIRLTAGRDRDEVVIRIVDNGVGIAPDMLPRMFDPFTHANAGPARPGGGLGVGLALARKFVELHGGRVAVTSPGPGLGSEFVVRVPAAPRRLAARRVLVVDDNADGLDMVVLLLERFGHVVATAKDGIQAVEVARAFKPEVMLLDLSLPGRDGHEVARILREEFPKGKLWLVAMSGYGRDEDRQRTREAGFDDHLVKPVEPATLQEALNDAPRQDVASS
jgi:signal transduction histidine kinase/DNA-binding response OmpR family regulator